jgi:hypothetical protein
MSAGQLPPELAAQLRALWRTASPETIPAGVLVRFGAAELPDGGAGPTPLSQPAWKAAYMRIECGALAPETVRPLAELLALVGGYRPDGPLPLAIARFRYAVLSAALLARIVRAAAEGRALRNPPPTLEGQVEERDAFICCGLLHEQWGRTIPVHRGLRVPFLLTPALVLSNRGAWQPQTVEIDPGDGHGFRVIEPEAPIEVDYSGDMSAQVAVRCLDGADTLDAGFTLALSDQPAAPAADQQWPLAASCGNTGTAHLYLARESTEVRHPLIMVEGFPGGHPPDEIYDTLNQQGTADALRAAGYDLVIVALDQGSDRIQRNAEVLVECIRAAIARTDEPLVVGGLSMGGLVSRYALLTMEQRGEPHNTCVFLTIDTPHEGAYTSLAAQWFARTFASDLPGLALYSQLLDAPANQQFDMWVLHGRNARVAPLREQFVEELANLGGYPRVPRRLAVSCGRGDGVPSGPSGALTLDWTAEPWFSVQLHALSDAAQQTLAEGHWLLADPQQLAPLHHASGPAWDVAPGGQGLYNAQVAATAAMIGCASVSHTLDISCAVPTVSALGIKADPFTPVPAPGSKASPFHDYAFADANYPHLTITPQLSAWLLGTLGDPRAAGKDVSHA